jgi:DNA-binding NtrC family response regulator
VDDDESARRAVAYALRSEDYDVRLAAGVLEALKLIHERPADVVVSDQMMPVMNGLQLMREVRKKLPDSIWIIVTGCVELERLNAATLREGEVYRFLSKPWDQLELQFTLRQAFERVALERENRRLLASVRRQSDFIRVLEARHPRIFAKLRAACGQADIGDLEPLGSYPATLRGLAG